MESIQMPKAKRRKPHNPAKAHDRRSRDLLRNAEVATVEVDNPLALEPGEKIVALRSIRNDPLGRLHSHRQIDEAQYQAGRAFQNDWEKAERGPRAGRPDPGVCRRRADARADHRGPAQGSVAAEPGGARTRRRRFGAGARCPRPWPDHGSGRATARTAHPALERIFFPAVPRMPRPAGTALWLRHRAPDSGQKPPALNRSGWTTS